MNSANLFDYSVFPVLSTERLRIRRPQLTDAVDVLVFRSDPEVQRFNGPVFQDAAEAESLIQDLQTVYDAKTGITWAVALKEENTVVGLFGFHDWNRYHRRSDVGYDLARAYWGQGIASEALRAILNFGFSRMDLNRAEAETIADNHESVRLLERIGFQREGTRRSYSWEDDGTFHAGAIYGLLKSDYQ